MNRPIHSFANCVGQTQHQKVLSIEFENVSAKGKSGPTAPQLQAALLRRQLDPREFPTNVNEALVFSHLNLAIEEFGQVLQS